MAVLLSVFVCCFAVQAAYAVFLFSKSYNVAGRISKGALEGVSIIICAKNEAKNLAENLPVILAQKYEMQEEQGGQMPWEVIVVDDGSIDETASVLQSFLQEKHLRVVSVPAAVPRTLPGKKLAMQLGVAASRYPWILTTDADCVLHSEYWLKAMTAPLLNHDVVIGYGRLEAGPGLLSRYIQGETLFSFIQSAAFAGAGIPSSATGRNMAFRKSFYEQQKSGKFSAVPSGDDDLLLHGPVRPKVAVVTHPDAQTSSPAKENLKEYLAQKRRHASTGKYYRPSVKALLGLYGLTQALFWISAIILTIFFGNAIAGYVISGVLIRWLFFSVSWYHNASLLGLKRVPVFLFFDICWLLFNAVLAPYIFWKNKQTWS